jgi:uncharacterized iron-regulated protein
MLPETMFEPMALAQRARDATMGSAMLASRGRPVVLIAGAGHARTDRGVPEFLRAHGPAGSKIVSLEFQEVETGVNEPRPSPFEFVWYTPRATDEDPCAKMKGR